MAEEDAEVVVLEGFDRRPAGKLEEDDDEGLSACNLDDDFLLDDGDELVRRCVWFGLGLGSDALIAIFVLHIT